MSIRTQRVRLTSQGADLLPSAVQSIGKQGRKLRKPSHTWQLRNRPYQIQPSVLAPVLPGETLQKAMLQCRVITDPIKNDMLGWWNEHYYFYVTLRQCVADDSVIEQFFINPGAGLSSLNTVAKTETYHYASSLDWAQMCLDAVTKHFFREEGEANNVASLGNLYQAAAVSPTDSWTDSLVVDDGAGSLPALQGDKVPLFDDDEVLTGYEEAFNRMQQMRMVDLTYEEYLRQQGVNIPGPDRPDMPELIRYIRDFKYPGRVIDTTTGAATAAVSWAITGGIDSPRFFKEPGFIFGVTVSRPKIYMSGQRGAAAHMLDNVASWLPAMFDNEPYLALKNIAATSGPWSSSQPYWVDVRDLYLYGDQFLNFDVAAAGDGGSVILPRNPTGTTVEKKYATSASIDALFVDAAGGKNLVRQDGVLKLHIKSRIREQT